MTFRVCEIEGAMDQIIYQENVFCLEFVAVT